MKCEQVNELPTKQLINICTMIQLDVAHDVWLGTVTWDHLVERKSQAQAHAQLSLAFT